MTTYEILTLLITSGSLLGIATVIFKAGKFTQKFEDFQVFVDQRFKEVNGKLVSIDERFNKMDEKIDKGFERLETKIDAQSAKIVMIEITLGKLETRVEERTLRVVHVDKRINEDQGGTARTV